MTRTAEVGDVVVVALARHVPPGHEQQGYRPAVLVGLPERLATPRYPIALVVPLTTRYGEGATASPALYPRLERGTGGLPQMSTVLLDNLRAVDARRVVRWLGSLTREDFAPIHDGLQRLLGLESQPAGTPATSEEAPSVALNG